LLSRQNEPLQQFVSEILDCSPVCGDQSLSPGSGDREQPVAFRVTNATAGDGEIGWRWLARHA
jgi:hypothetical protein